MSSLAHQKSEAPSGAHMGARGSRKAAAAETERTHVTARLQRTIGNRALQRLLQETASSKSADRGKCPACQAAGGSCAECAKREIAVQRALKTSDMMLDIRGERKKPEAAEMLPELGKAEAVKCPRQKVSILSPLCGAEHEALGPGVWYGAVGKYCYIGTKNWVFSEHVVMESDDCNLPGVKIQQKPTPGLGEAGSPCLIDYIVNPGLPPAKKCKTVTRQTVFAGPSEASAKQCEYTNKQVIEVQVNKHSDPKSGKVITSSHGEKADCDWTQAK
jgi:hypothetical protein